MVGWPFENSFVVPAKSQPFAGLGQSSPKDCVLNQWTVCFAISLTARIHSSKNQGVEMGVAPLPLYLVAHYEITGSCSSGFMLCWPRGLSSRGKNAST